MDLLIYVLLAVVVLGLGVFVIVWYLPASVPPAARDTGNGEASDGDDLDPDDPDRETNPARADRLTIEEAVTLIQRHNNALRRGVPASGRADVLSLLAAVVEEEPDEPLQDGEPEPDEDTEPTPAPAIARAAVPALPAYVIQGPPTEPATLYGDGPRLTENSQAWRWAGGATGSWAAVDAKAPTKRGRRNRARAAR